MEKSNDKMIKCSACGNPVSRDARSCPKCGQPTPKHKMLWIWAVIFVIGILLQAIARGC